MTLNDMNAYGVAERRRQVSVILAEFVDALAFQRHRADEAEAALRKIHARVDRPEAHSHNGETNECVACYVTSVCRLALGEP